MAELQHSNHAGIEFSLVGGELRAGVPTERISGGNDFVDQSGSVTLDLASSRSFHHVMVGNITSLAFSNIPDEGKSSASWTWVLRIDSTGDYSLTGTPSVTWVDGRSWSDLNLSADAENIVTFWRVGSTTFAALVWNGDVELDPYKVCFLEDSTIHVITEDEEIDAGNVVKNGNGTITVKRKHNSTTDTITTRTAFDAGNLLVLECSGTTGTKTTVRIPRYAR